jgi:mRNA-degrading endonuclease YafQ of YafQ-DinJ toxin-antitoxin module
MIVESFLLSNKDATTGDNLIVLVDIGSHDEVY